MKRGEGGTAIFDFPYGIKPKSIMAHLQTSAYNENANSIGNIKISYSTDNGENWTLLTSHTNLALAGRNKNQFDTMPAADGSYSIRPAYADVNQVPQNMLEYNIDDTLNTTITNIKLEISNNSSYSSQNYIDQTWSIYVSNGITNTKIDGDLSVVSKTGMWNGGTGSMAVEDSGVIQFSKAIPENTFIKILIALPSYWDSDTGHTRSQIKRMNLQASTNGTVWTNVNVPGFWNDGTIMKPYYNLTHGDEEPSIYWVTLPAGYKYFRFYTDQTQASVEEALDAIYLKGISYYITANAPSITSDLATSTQTIAQSFYIINGDGKLNYTVQITVDPEGTPYTTTVGATATSPTNVTNPNNSKDCIFTITGNSNLLGTAKINSFLGAFI